METRKKTGRKIVDVAVRGCSLVATVLALALMGWILWTVVREGAGALSWDLLIHRSRPYGEPGSGTANALGGTLVITLGAAALAIPLALLAGIGLAEFGGTGRFTGICRFAINLLMGVPSVIVGLFVYGVLVVPTGHFSGFAGSVALAMLMFAVAVRTTEDQIALVPTALREAGLTAFAAWPPERMRDYGGAVAAVDVGTAESGPMGFCNYLGQTYDQTLGTAREVYGKQLEAEILVDLRAQRAADCEAACAQAADVLLGGLAEGIRCGELAWEGLCWDKAAGMFRRRGRLQCRAVFVAEAGEDDEPFLDFRLKGVLTT